MAVRNQLGTSVFVCWTSMRFLKPPQRVNHQLSRSNVAHIMSILTRDNLVD